MKTTYRIAAAALGFTLILTGQTIAQESADSVAYDAILAQDWAAAEAQLTAALKANPKDPFGLLNLAYVMRATGREDEAKKIYERVMAMDVNPLAELGEGKARRVKTIAKKSIAAMQPQ